MFTASKSDKKSPTDANSNIFLGAIMNALSKQNADANDIFKVLMEFYISTAEKTYYKVPLHWRTSHAADAKKCLVLFDKHSKEQVIPEAIKLLNNTQNIKLGGFFSQALSTYFAMFPNYLDQCSGELRAVISKLDLWESAIYTSLTQYMQTHRNGTGNHQHELLQKLSLIIPDNITNNYADFLLEQLRHPKRHEAIPGLYKGWVYAALGTLAPRLNIAKREAVNQTLLAAFADQRSDLSVIGLCEALSNANLSASKQEEIASSLYIYIMKNISELMNMHEDHQQTTISLYGHKAFTTLKPLEKYLKEALRNGLINPMLQSEDSIYKLRFSILALESWIPDARKLEVMNALNINKNFLELAPLFWRWLDLDKNKDNSWATHTKLYASHIKQARSDLTGVITPDDVAANQVQLLVVDHTTNENIRADIIQNLIEQLTDCNRENSHHAVRKEIHRALVNIKPWTSPAEQATIARLLQTGCCANLDASDDVRISSANAAMEYFQSLSESAAISLRNNLLMLLDGSCPSEAATALQTYAEKSGVKDLAQLMTCVMAKGSNGYAQLLLTDLHAEYRELEKNVENRVRMVV